MLHSVSQRLSLDYRGNDHVTIFVIILTFQSQWDGTKIEERIQNLCYALLDSIYDFVSHGLFKTDKMAFALHLTHLMHEDAFEPNVRHGISRIDIF